MAMPRVTLHDHALTRDLELQPGRLHREGRVEVAVIGDRRQVGPQRAVGLRAAG